LADKTKTGKKYSFTWLVERGKIRELVEAIGDNNPIYRDAKVARQQGYKDIIAPPTFATVPILWTGTLLQILGDIGTKFERLMHAEESYEYVKEIFPGDILTGIMEIKGITEKKGESGALDFIQLKTTYANQCNEVVLKEEMLIVERK